MNRGGGSTRTGPPSWGEGTTHSFIFIFIHIQHHASGVATLATRFGRHQIRQTTGTVAWQRPPLGQRAKISSTIACTTSRVFREPQPMGRAPSRSSRSGPTGATIAQIRGGLSPYCRGNSSLKNVGVFPLCFSLATIAGGNWERRPSRKLREIAGNLQENPISEVYTFLLDGT